MSAPRFTPGPWAIHEDGDVIAMGPSGNYPIKIAGVDPFEPLTRENVTANAHLIAAAPEMYDALEAVAAVLGATFLPPGHPLKKVYRQVTDALAKAEGRS